MVLKLYGFHLSTCTRRVATVLHEKKVPFEFIQVDISKGEHKAPGFVKHQPFGVVPYIDDDGFILYESRAIAYYIATKYANQGTPLIPSDLKKLALFQQALSIEVTGFNDYAEKIAVEKVFKPMRGGTTDEAAVERYVAGLTAKLDVYDKILANQKYLGGNELTLADLHHLPYGSILPMCGVTLIDQKPNVKRWFDELASRPSWEAVKGGVTSKESY